MITSMISTFYYLKIILELGLVGLFFFLWMIASAAQMALRLFRTATDPVFCAIGCALFATLVCAAMVNLFGDRWSYLQVNGFLWVFMGMAARGLWMTQKAREQEETGDISAGIESSDMTEVVPA